MRGGNLNLQGERDYGGNVMAVLNQMNRPESESEPIQKKLKTPFECCEKKKNEQDNPSAFTCKNYPDNFKFKNTNTNVNSVQEMCDSPDLYRPIEIEKSNQYGGVSNKRTKNQTRASKKSTSPSSLSSSNKSVKQAEKAYETAEKKLQDAKDKVRMAQDKMKMAKETLQSAKKEARKNS